MVSSELVNTAATRAMTWEPRAPWSLSSLTSLTIFDVDRWRDAHMRDIYRAAFMMVIDDGLGLEALSAFDTERFFKGASALANMLVQDQQRFFSSEPPRITVFPPDEDGEFSVVVRLFVRKERFYAVHFHNDGDHIDVIIDGAHERINLEHA